MQETSLSLLISSDIHGWYLPWDYTKDEEDVHGSLAQLSTLIKSIKKDHDHVLTFDAGDLVQGNASSLFAKDPVHPGILALNAIGYDGWVLGNHEFDYGPDFIRRAQDLFQGDILLANLLDKEGKPYFKPYKIYDFDGIQVAIVGLITPLVGEFKEKSSILKEFTIQDPVQALERVFADMPPVDAKIGIFHMGIQNENAHPNTGVRDIVQKLSTSFDLVAGAHMHQLERGLLIDKTLVAEAGMFATHLLKMDLHFKKTPESTYISQRSSSLIPIYQDGDILAPDKEIIDLLKPYHLKAKKTSEEVLGQVDQAMVAPSSIPNYPHIASYPSAWTAWIGSVLLEASGADVVAFHLDNPYPKIFPGPFRKKDIYRNYHYAGGEMSVYKIQAWQLRRYMEWSVSYFNRLHPGDVTLSIHPKRARLKYSTFDFFSGLDYTVDYNQPVGQRIVSLTYDDGQPVQDHDLIRLGINSYRMKALLSQNGVLAGEDIPFLYATTDDDQLGPKKGRIQDLLKEDVRRRGSLGNNFHSSMTVVGPDTSSREAQASLKLLELGYLKLDPCPSKSINIYENMPIQDQKDLFESLGLEAPLQEDARRGEIYLKCLNFLGL